jgi:hypothetical protein
MELFKVNNIAESANKVIKINGQKMFVSKEGSEKKNIIGYIDPRNFYNATKYISDTLDVLVIERNGEESFFPVTKTPKRPANYWLPVSTGDREGYVGILQTGLLETKATVSLLVAIILGAIATSGVLAMALCH